MIQPGSPFQVASAATLLTFVTMDAIYHRTHLGDSLLHALQHLCVAGELEGAEARRIIADFNEVPGTLFSEIRYEYLVQIIDTCSSPTTCCTVVPLCTAIDTVYHTSYSYDDYSSTGMCCRRLRLCKANALQHRAQR